MATPTPGKPPAVVATPPVSTPFSQSHLAFSPRAPRGSVVPSPQQVKKSPANSNTLYGHPTNSSFGAMNFDSPSAAAALGLGDMSLDLPLAMARGEDDQKVRLGQIMDILKVNKGRVTEEGLERLTRRLGLTYFPDNHPRGGEDVTKTILLVGARFSIDVNFSNDAIHTVVLGFLESNEGVTKWKEKAGKVFLKDLEYAPGENPLTKMLGGFADNLERLATLDKLGVPPTLNCLEAVAGIYDSLIRIHDWEIARLKEQEGAGKDDGWLMRNVICTKSGRPVMHERQRVGLSVEYWQKKRLISTMPKSNSVSPKTWAMVIECTNAPNVSFTNPPEEPYTRVRVSDAWVSQSILKSNPSPEDLMSTAAHNTLIDWLEPGLTLVPATDASKADAVMQGMPLDAAGESKLPDVMFIAKFEPPVVIPNYIADWVYHVIRATPSLFPSIPHVTYIDSLLLPLAAEEMIMNPSRQVERQRKVPIVDKNGGKSSRLHRSTLFVQKLDPGYELRELPFSHPRQLIEIMPFLRQYAFLATLMDKSFGAKTEKILSNESNQNAKKATNNKDDFMKFMQAPEEKLQDTKTLNLDITLITEPGVTMQPPFPGPKIEVVFPFRNRSAHVAFEIGLNGVVSVLHENVLPKDDDNEMGALNGGTDKKPLTMEDLARMLEISEDLGIFAEYVRRRLG